MQFTEKAEYSSLNNLYVDNKKGYVGLYDNEKGFLGNFEVWHDSEHDNDEYFILNGSKIYLDNIIEK